MRVAAVVFGLLPAVVCSGCGFNGGRAAIDAGAVPDAPDDTEIIEPPDAPDAGGDDGCASFSQQLNTCVLSFGGDLTIPGPGPATYSTASGMLNANNMDIPVTHRLLATREVDIDAILAHNVTIAAGVTLRVTGATTGESRPFAIIASGTVTIEDGVQIDVSDGGAGAATVCSTPAKSGMTSLAGIGGGGGGGGFASGGGRGGTGSSDGPTAGGGEGAFSITVLGPRGGCGGARGGFGSLGTFGAGAGGKGGGAIYIVSAGRMVLGDAVLLANGGGGHGGAQHDPNLGDAGGGGGGTGGMIVLEAPQIIAPMARMFANGGGGGEGSTVVAAGNDGQPGSTTTAAARGGNGGPDDGGDGGDGGATTAVEGQTAIAARRGGGGGGGSAGYVFIVSPSAQLSANISPAPVVSQ